VHIGPLIDLIELIDWFILRVFRAEYFFGPGPVVCTEDDVCTRVADSYRILQLGRTEWLNPDLYGCPTPALYSCIEMSMFVGGKAWQYTTAKS